MRVQVALAMLLLPTPLYYIAIAQRTTSIAEPKEQDWSFYSQWNKLTYPGATTFIPAAPAPSMSWRQYHYSYRSLVSNKNNVNLSEHLYFPGHYCWRSTGLWTAVTIIFTLVLSGPVNNRNSETESWGTLSIMAKPCLKIGECSSHVSTFFHPQMTPHIDPNTLSRITTNRNFWFRKSQHYASPRKLFNQLVPPLPHSKALSKQGEGDSFQERTGLRVSTFAVEDCLAQPPAIWLSLLQDIFLVSNLIR